MAYRAEPLRSPSKRHCTKVASATKGSLQMQNSVLKTFCIFTQFALLTISLAQHSAAQKQHITLENSKTGVYRALAQLTFRSFREGDAETAATLGRILDRTWDQIEESGERGLKKSDPKLFERIDEAMDAFIKPVIHYDR